MKGIKIQIRGIFVDELFMYDPEYLFAKELFL